MRRLAERVPGARDSPAGSAAPRLPRRPAELRSWEPFGALAGRRERALAPGLEVVAERRLGARPGLRLVAGGGPDDLEGDGVGADGRDPEQPPVRAEGDEVAGLGAASDRPEAELGPAGLGPLDRRVRLLSHQLIVSTGNTLALPPFGLAGPA